MRVTPSQTGLRHSLCNVIDLLLNCHFPTNGRKGLPGYRETLIEFFEAMEDLSIKLLPLFATALSLPSDYFDPFFPKYRNIAFQRLSHYPADPLEEDQYNSSPHTDGTFLTLLATN